MIINIIILCFFINTNIHIRLFINSNIFIIIKIVILGFINIIFSYVFLCFVIIFLINYDFILL